MPDEAQKMRQWAEQHVALLRDDPSQSPFDSMLIPQLVDCDPEKKEMTLQFPVQDWQINDIAALHGGVVVSMADLVMGMIAYYYAPERVPPTISLTVNYHLPVPPGSQPLFRGRLTALSRRVAATYCEVVLPDGSLACTCIATYAVTRKKS